MVAKLARIRDEKARDARCPPHGTPVAGRTQTSGERDKAAQAAAPRQARRAPRPSLRRPASQHTPLSIRSAERRRWSADLTRPDVTALVRARPGRNRQVDPRHADRVRG